MLNKLHEFLISNNYGEEILTIILLGIIILVICSYYYYSVKLKKDKFKFKSALILLSLGAQIYLAIHGFSQEPAELQLPVTGPLGISVDSFPTLVTVILFASLFGTLEIFNLIDNKEK